jgi:hypothetical protein
MSATTETVDLFESARRPEEASTRILFIIIIAGYLALAGTLLGSIV